MSHPTYPAGQGQHLSYQGDPPAQNILGTFGTTLQVLTSVKTNEQMNVGERSHVPHSTREGSGWRAKLGSYHGGRLCHGPPRLLRMQLVPCVLNLLSLGRAISERVKQNLPESGDASHCSD